jgi:uncharacterized protein YkwD
MFQRDLSDLQGMKTRLHLSFLFGLVAAAVLALPGVSGADNASAGPAQSLVNMPEASVRLLELINADRAQAGLQPLASRADVASIALTFSRQMATEANVWHNQDYLSQGSLQRLNAVSVGENVSRTATVERAHVALMNSPHHRANILSPKFRIVGVGVVRDSADNVYVTQDFLTPAERSPAGSPAASKAPPARHGAGPAWRSGRGRSHPRPRALPRPRPSRRRR